MVRLISMYHGKGSFNLGTSLICKFPSGLQISYFPVTHCMQSMMPKAKLFCASLPGTPILLPINHCKPVSIDWCSCCASCAVFLILLFHLQQCPLVCSLPSHGEASCMLTNQLLYLVLSLPLFSFLLLSDSKQK